MCDFYLVISAIDDMMTNPLGVDTFLGVGVLTFLTMCRAISAGTGRVTQADQYKGEETDQMSFVLDLKPWPSRQRYPTFL